MAKVKILQKKVEEFIHQNWIYQKQYCSVKGYIYFQRHINQIGWMDISETKYEMFRKEKDAKITYATTVKNFA